MDNTALSHHAGYGLHPKYLPEILGKKVNRDIEKGTRFTFELLA